MRTYTREDIDASRLAWAELRLTPSWDAIRRLAGERGMLYPPTGTRWDSWEDPMPSQFALVARAVNDGWRDRLLEVIGQSRSWSDVVHRLLADRDTRSEQVTLRERDTEWEREHRPGHGEAAKTIGQILSRIADSAGVER